MGDLSVHFSRDEFRCQGEHCCGHAGPVSDRLINALEELRTALCTALNKTDVPIIINSGFRCPVHNREVNGSLQSFHMTGEAADIRVAGITPVKLASIAKKVFEFREGGIGVYPQWLHVDVRKSAQATWFGSGS